MPKIVEKKISDIRFMVVLREYERGWGSKDFMAFGYKSHAAAKAKAEKVNAGNTAPFAPDYYVQARVETDPDTFKNYMRLL